MSDSILYLAIVAIWAGFLIPAWVRRPHSSRAERGFEAAEFEFEIDNETGPVTPADADPGRHFEPAPTADLDTSVPAEVTDTESEYRDDVHTHNYAPAGPDPRHQASRPPVGPSQSREQMLRARRRMLTILVGLTCATVLFAFTGLVQWWICVPPVALLVLYVLLLREIALADAELARKRQAWEAGQAQAAAWRLEQEHSEPEAPEQTAEIIDISSRVGDQFYDQYADAAVRAVGD